ncbi:hypothetical protein [Micrococcus sp.]|uniref:hypothetical protein n=1 Tax=Micrococcus sp. TaxID=1271 RepID=UPI002A911ECA|nr:hypothetical protein [Micrococcus sp.]MDY6056029.1 hypothetical protein [Micrococcus sp.]
MAPRLPWLVTRDTPALRHLADLCLALGRAVTLMAQLSSTTGQRQDRVERELTDLDGTATASLMAFLTALRSSYVTPIPRQDLYQLAGGVHTAAHRVVGAGVMVQRAGLEELPAPALDLLETVGRQAELLRRAMDQLRDLDALEDTWMQLESGVRRMDRILVEWLAGLGHDLLQRDFNRQREVAWALQSAVESLSRVNSCLGMVLVRES